MDRTSSTICPTDQILALLIEERDNLSQATETLQGSAARRAAMSAAARKAQSRRMKRYWAKRRKELAAKKAKR